MDANEYVTHRNSDCSTQLLRLSVNVWWSLKHFFLLRGERRGGWDTWHLKGATVRKFWRFCSCHNFRIFVSFFEPSSVNTHSANRWTNASMLVYICLWLRVPPAILPTSLQTMQQCDHAAVKRRACANQLSFRYRAAISGNLKENKKKTKQNKTPKKNRFQNTICEKQINFYENLEILKKGRKKIKVFEHESSLISGIL